MTDEELTAIEEVISRAQQSSGMAAGHDVAMIHAPALLAEVRSLRAEREKADKALTQALRSLVETRDERDALRKVYDAAARYCYNRTVENEHGLTGATWDALAVQP